jgi:hypothetical protein
VLYLNLQLYADNGRLGLRVAVLLVSMELLAERVIVVYVAMLRDDNRCIYELIVQIVCVCFMC